MNKLVCSNCDEKFDGPVVLTPSQAAETTDATIKCPICKTGTIINDSGATDTSRIGSASGVCDPRLVTTVGRGRLTRPI